MHFLHLGMKTLLVSTVIFGLSLLGLVAAIPVDTPGVVEAHVEKLEATHLSSRKPARGGWATYYNTEGGRGACGKYNHNREYVVAIGKPLWESTQGWDERALRQNRDGKVARQECSSPGCG
ncbi:hypothetical protein ACGC1H_000581 [Rhizoctonia solani]